MIGLPEILLGLALVLGLVVPIAAIVLVIWLVVKNQKKKEEANGKPTGHVS